MRIEAVLSFIKILPAISDIVVVIGDELISTLSLWAAGGAVRELIKRQRGESSEQAS
jgi:hypothetical protein